MSGHFGENGWLSAFADSVNTLRLTGKETGTKTSPASMVRNFFESAPVPAKEQDQETEMEPGADLDPVAAAEPVAEQAAVQDVASPVAGPDSSSRRNACDDVNLDETSTGTWTGRPHVVLLQTRIQCGFSRSLHVAL